MENFWLIILGLGIGTFLIRFSFVGFSHRFHITPDWKELFSYIPACLFPALIVPGLFFDQGQVQWLWGKEKLIVALLALGVSALTRSILWTLGSGLLVLYILR
ncbi:MAG: AzlD domain-containing protein [Proteobacteria bacterium]|jgi:branched-subunit amino acid transport protein|nr:AzlD domain-containing protein [Pseudomonadota bacterium]